MYYLYSEYCKKTPFTSCHPTLSLIDKDIQYFEGGFDKMLVAEACHNMTRHVHFYSNAYDTVLFLNTYKLKKRS